MRPIVHGLEDRYGDRIDFVYLNIDDPSTAQAKEQYGYRVQPHFFLVDSSGQIAESWLGSVQETAFVAAFDQVLTE
jgi:hypothetical protein